MDGHPGARLAVAKMLPVRDFPAPRQSNLACTAAFLRGCDGEGIPHTDIGASVLSGVSRFLVELVASSAEASMPRPPNLWNNRSVSIRSTDCRSPSSL
jgi:hypothetical protein